MARGWGPGDAPPPGCHRGGRAPRCPFPESPEQRGAVVSVSETRWTPLPLWAPAARRADCASRVRVRCPPIRFPCCRLPREVPPALAQRRTSPKAPELRPKLPRAHRLLSQRDPQAPERAPSLRPGQRAHLGHPWGGPLAPTAPPSGVRSRPCRRTWGLRTGEPLRVEGRRVSRGRWRVRQRAGPAGQGRCAPRLG